MKAVMKAVVKAKVPTEKIELKNKII